MLLQGSRTAERPSKVVTTRHEQITVRPVQPGEESVPAPTLPLSRRTYAPITWEHPSLGKVVVGGIGEITRTAVLFVLLAAAFVGTAMGIAILVTSIIQGLGVDASAPY
ncbi:hypothetical protein [Actinoplanes sp. NPDC026619]|uniref:hypothetical protein n=1 Tax=Actinoplanes sp. NPDC026619 TaxID=3155798 RepID=UPI003407D257